MAAEIIVQTKSTRAQAASHLASAGDGTSTRVETITPAKAARWIEPEINSHNRNLMSRRVTQYARDMREGRWRFGNDAICFDRNGVLLNGQHRLHACVLANVSFRAVVIRGMEPEAQTIMDQHGVRSLGGILQLHGHPYTALLSGALRALIQIDHAGEGHNNYRPSNQELLDVLRRHPKIQESCVAVAKTNASRGISTSTLAAIHYVGKNLLKEETKADAFVRVFLTGVPAYPKDPAHALRENALRHASKKTRKTGALAFYSLIRAWNAFRDDQTYAKWMSPKSDIVVVKGLKRGMI